MLWIILYLMKCHMAASINNTAKTNCCGYHGWEKLVMRGLFFLWNHNVTWDAADQFILQLQHTENQPSEHLWRNHSLALHGSSLRQHWGAFVVTPSQCSEGFQCIVVVRWTGQIPLGLLYAISLLYKDKPLSLHLVCNQVNHSVVKTTNFFLHANTWESQLL